MNQFKNNLRFLVKQEKENGNKDPRFIRLAEHWINNFINSFANPSIDELWDIADRFGISVDDLIKKDLSAKSKISKKEIKLLIIDVDSALTDGSIYYNENGESWRKLSSLDQNAVTELAAKKVEVALTCNKESAAFFKAIAKAWNIDKLSSASSQSNTAKKWMDEMKIKTKNVAYIGTDEGLHKQFDASASPANFSTVSAEIQLNKAGGSGCVWEFFEEYLV